MTSTSVFPHSEDYLGVKCTSVTDGDRACLNLARFKPAFFGEDRKRDRREYFKHRYRVLNATSKIEATAPKNVLRYCNRKSSKTLKMMELDLALGRRITCAIGRQMFGPTKVDCWNHKYLHQKEKARSLRNARNRKIVNDNTKANLALMVKFSKTSSQYSRYEQLRDWEAGVTKFVDGARFDHNWKDPFYTPAVLYDDTITRPTDIDKLRWIDHKDPHMIERRGGMDWSKEEFEDMLKLMWNLKCSEQFLSVSEALFCNSLETRSTSK